MFIKWSKEVFGDWWGQFGGLIAILYTGYSLICLIFCIADLLVSADGIAKDWVWIHQYLIPFMWITGILPSIVKSGWIIGSRIQDLYIDYQYFVANGGKRKHSGGYDPYRSDDESVQ